MRSRTSLLASALILLLVSLSATPGFAAGATVRDGGNLQLGGVTYRLDGIEAPAFDQICIDEHADAWTCGAAARDQLTKLIGDRQVRNRGTIGGGLAHADPASDMPAVMLALDATFNLRSKRGRRSVQAREFFLGPFSTALADDEFA